MGFLHTQQEKHFSCHCLVLYSIFFVPFEITRGRKEKKKKTKYIRNKSIDIIKLNIIQKNFFFLLVCCFCCHCIKAPNKRNESEWINLTLKEFPDGFRVAKLSLWQTEKVSSTLFSNANSSYNNAYMYSPVVFLVVVLLLLSICNQLINWFMSVTLMQWFHIVFCAILGEQNKWTQWMFHVV